MRIGHILFLATSVISASLAANASSITYNVSLSFDGATAVGTITTDGTIGTLTQAEITGFSLLLTQGTDSLLETQATAQRILQGTPVSATATQLLFDFGAPGLLDFQIVPFHAQNFLCIQGSDNLCDGPPSGFTESVGKGSDGHAGLVSFGPQTGTQILGTVATPEPSSVLLLGTGLLGVVGAARRRLKV